MRRIVLLSLALFLCLPTPFTPPAQAQNQAPHAWLFGTWTGGIFPAPQQMTSQACFSQPTVIFTRDLVLRATLTQQQLVQREIETARATTGSTEFRFAATLAAPQAFAAGPVRAGFGCNGPDDLTVQRRGENEITFPGCADFPYPLVRCR